MISAVIEESIQKALKELNLFDVEIGLEHPDDLLHGDFSSNVAL
ncbi:hypothetical protein KGQ31_02965, partial [Patescibacteria group bacterium]|nr:hypothetical protein [Patescibacteria group bacterium]